MKEDAIIKSTEGLVPFEEVNTLGGQFDLGGDEEVAVAAAPAPKALAEDGSETDAAAAEAPAEEIKI